MQINVRKSCVWGNGLQMRSVVQWHYELYSIKEVGVHLGWMCTWGGWVVCIGGRMVCCMCMCWGGCGILVCVGISGVRMWPSLANLSKPMKPVCNL